MLLSRHEAYAVRALITVAPVTTRIRSIPAEVSLGCQDGLPRDCIIHHRFRHLHADEGDLLDAVDTEHPYLVFINNVSV